MLTAHISARTGGLQEREREEQGYIVSISMSLKLRPDLSIAVQTPEVCPLIFFREVRTGVEGAGNV